MKVILGGMFARVLRRQEVRRASSNHADRYDVAPDSSGSEADVLGQCRLSDGEVSW
jgi:hypothetical protein